MTTFLHRHLSPAALDLAQKLLSPNPDSRLTAAEALQAPYFLDEQPQSEVPVRCVMNSDSIVPDL